MRRDDLAPIADEVLHSDLLILATPIYSWYCPGPMKNVLDRFVYGFNKYYGTKKGPSLWAGKKVALFVTIFPSKIRPLSGGFSLLAHGPWRLAPAGINDQGKTAPYSSPTTTTTASLTTNTGSPRCHRYLGSMPLPTGMARIPVGSRKAPFMAMTAIFQ